MKNKLNPVFNIHEVESIMADTIQHLKDLLLSKGVEYCRNNDRFHNFNRTAEAKRITPERALDGFLQKHITSYNDILDDLDKGIFPTEQLVTEKLDDILVYFLLQKTQLILRIQKTQEKESDSSSDSSQWYPEKPYTGPKVTVDSPGTIINK